MKPPFLTHHYSHPSIVPSQVGKDFVKKGQNVDQVAFSVSATSKSLFARLFDWIVAKVNDSLDAPNPRKYFIGKRAGYSGRYSLHKILIVPVMNALDPK